jgi:putative ABC transport system permease protein
MKDYFILASKNLKKRGIRSWLTLIGIFIGIAAVISLISLGNVLKDTVSAQFGVSSLEIISVQAGGLSEFGPVGTTGATPLTKDDVLAIERLSNVDVALGRKIETVNMEFNEILKISWAVTNPEGKEKEVYKTLELDVEIGRLIYDSDRRLVLLGNDFLDGDKNGFEREIRVNDKILIEGEEFRVAGFLERQGSFTLDGAIWISERDLNEIKPFGEDVDIIAVKVRDKEKIDQTKEEIERLLRKRRDVKEGEEDFEVSTPEAMLSTVNQILVGIQIFIVIIASVSILVGAIGITNTMATSVLERKKEIGTMKAIGSKNKDIFYQFFVEAGLLGLIGGFMGVAFGIFISYIGTYSINIFLGTETKPTINLFLMFFSILGSFLIGAISGVFPAMQAAKENPVEAIRG